MNYHDSPAVKISQNQRCSGPASLLDIGKIILDMAYKANRLCSSVYCQIISLFCVPPCQNVLLDEAVDGLLVVKNGG